MFGNVPATESFPALDTNSIDVSRANNFWVSNTHRALFYVQHSSSGYHSSSPQFQHSERYLLFIVPQRTHSICVAVTLRRLFCSHDIFQSPTKFLKVWSANVESAGTDKEDITFVRANFARTSTVRTSVSFRVCLTHQSSPPVAIHLGSSMKLQRPKRLHFPSFRVLQFGSIRHFVGLKLLWHFQQRSESIKFRAPHPQIIIVGD